MSLIKYTCYAVGGAVTLAAVASFGGVGIAMGGVATGLSAFEVAVVGGAAGTTVAKIREDKARAARKQAAADKARRAAEKKADDIKASVAHVRQVLDDLVFDSSGPNGRLFFSNTMEILRH